MSFFIPDGGIDDSELLASGVVTAQQVVEAWGGELEEQLHHSLQLEGIDDGDLSQSIRYEVIQNGTVISFKLYFNVYGTFIDEGVKGAGGTRKTTSIFSGANRGRIFKQNAPGSRFSFKEGRRPKVSYFDAWSREKGLNKYAVRESVFRQGLKPKKWFTKIIDQNPFDKLTTELQVQGAKYIEVDLTNILKGKDIL